MRIILEPTQPVDTALPFDCHHHRVTIEHPSDDLSLDHVVLMVEQALVAYGFPKKMVEEYLNNR